MHVRCFSSKYRNSTQLSTRDPSNTCCRATTPTTPTPLCFSNTHFHPNWKRTLTQSSHFDQQILLELLHFEYPLVVYLYSSGEQPAVRNGEQPSAEGGVRGEGRVLPLPLYVKWMRASMHWQNIPSPKTAVCGGQMMHLCNCKKWHTKETSYSLFELITNRVIIISDSFLLILKM